MSQFIPEAWAASIQQDILDRLGPADEFLYGPKEQRRRGHVESNPYTKQELHTRKAALKAWRKLTDELTTKGWLEHESCYECGGELIPSTETEHTEWVYDETEEEHLARVGEPYSEPYVTFHYTTLKLPKIESA